MAAVLVPVRYGRAGTRIVWPAPLVRARSAQINTRGVAGRCPHPLPSLAQQPGRRLGERQRRAQLESVVLLIPHHVRDCPRDLGWGPQLPDKVAVLEDRTAMARDPVHPHRDAGAERQHRTPELLGRIALGDEMQVVAEHAGMNDAEILSLAHSANGCDHPGIEHVPAEGWDVRQRAPYQVHRVARVEHIASVMRHSRASRPPCVRPPSTVPFAGQEELLLVHVFHGAGGVRHSIRGLDGGLPISILGVGDWCHARVQELIWADLRAERPLERSVPCQYGSSGGCTTSTAPAGAFAEWQVAACGPVAFGTEQVDHA